LLQETKLSRVYILLDEYNCLLGIDSPLKLGSYKEVYCNKGSKEELDYLF